MYKVSYYHTDRINNNPKQETIYHFILFFQYKLTDSSRFLQTH